MAKSTKKKSKPTKAKASSGKKKLLFLLLILIGSGIFAAIYFLPALESEPEQPKGLKDLFKKIGQTTKETTKVVVDKTKAVIDKAKKTIEPITSKEEEFIEKPSKYSNSPHYAGVPQNIRYPNDLKILDNNKFILAYDEKRKNPAWTCYRVSKNDLEISKDKIYPYTLDTRIKSKVKPEDFAHTGYELTQLTPSDIMGLRFGTKYEELCFLNSNIFPLSPGLNSGPWKKLMNKIKLDYPNRFNDIWVMTGPIYDESISRLSYGIEIPDEIFVIIFDEFQNQPRYMALIFSQMATSSNLESYLTSIEEIETKTGFSLLSDLNQESAQLLKASMSHSVW